MSNDEKWIKVACRLCGKVMLFPKSTYKEKDLIGWECKGSLSKQCRYIYEREREQWKSYTGYR